MSKTRVELSEVGTQLGASELEQIRKTAEAIFRTQSQEPEKEAEHE